MKPPQKPTGFNATKTKKQVLRKIQMRKRERRERERVHVHLWMYVRLENFNVSCSLLNICPVFFIKLIKKS